jgi:hypothetical protein
MNFIRKRRKILPNRDRRFKDESSIFPTSITSKMVKNGQNRDFLPI